ncbi:MAG: triose-phosphate isomerase [gamma proteobacterium symbiont of Bathyaustriella thionipta]|nr:triose-phosphate isomerase [gamma proteobacterium symbiont of Bathyaustriella thionipta]
MRKPFVAGNWKMNGSRDSVRTLLDGIKAGMADVSVAEVAVCPPAIYIADVQQQLEGSAIGCGGQDVSTQASGAFTGEISTAMLQDFACRYTLVGHSERRTLHGEDDALVARKFSVASAAGLIPILCIGETLQEREANETESVVSRQLDAVIELDGIEALADCIIAYEPVWAIGTGKTASSAQAQEVHAFIRQKLAELNADVAEGVRILYGGSVKGSNAEELFGQTDIDGGLIGGASLMADDFLAICRAAR